jgi:lipopolysaccharide export system protein LptA
VDSCTAITQAEASAALGQAVRTPVRGKATVEGGIACVFYGPAVPAGANPDIPVSGSVRVVLVRGAQAQAFFADYRTKVHAERVPGLGDQAYYDGYASLSVLKGNAYIRIAVIGVRTVLDAEKMLAVRALPRM